MGGLRLWAAYVCRGDHGFVSQVAAFIVCRGAVGGTAQKKAEHGNKTFNFCRGVGAASQKRGGITWPQKPEFVGG